MVSDTLEQRIYELVRSHDGIYLFKKKELFVSCRLMARSILMVAINLYQLASTRPPVTRLMNFRRALSARDPDSGFYHEASDSFLAKNQTVNFLQIFQRQRGAKITVVLPDYTECLIYQ